MLLNNIVKTNIIMPCSPTAREVFAKDELSSYLYKALGIKTVEAQKPEDGANNIIIGAPARNKYAEIIITQSDFDALITGEEGIFIEIRENNAVIAGSCGYGDMERGTLYAVYEFAERYLGCSLAAYSSPDVKAGEIIPERDELSIENSRYCKPHADRPYRCAIIQYGESAGNPYHELNIPFIDWLAKNRYNRILAWASVYEAYKKTGLLDELEKRGIRISAGHHESSRMWLPYFGNEYFSERYCETHPEYYRLNQNGSRHNPNNKNDSMDQWIYCSRNTDCIEQVSKNLISWTEKNPLVDTIAFWPNDGIYGQCTCEKCSKYSKVENYTYFQNEVAKRVSAACPNIKIDMLVYVDLWECPSAVKLNPCLRVDEAAWAKEQRHCGKPDGSCLSNTDFESNIMGWKNAGAEVVYYDYYMGVYGNRQRIIPMADEIQSIWKRFAELGIAGAGTQIECYNIWNHLMNLYTFGRTAYDASLSFEDNLNSLCRLFGDGAEYIAEAIRQMENTLDGQEIIGYSGKYMIEHIDKENIYSLFEKALSAAKTATERNNIRLMRMAFRYSDVENFDTSNIDRKVYGRFQDYDDPTGELAYMGTHFDSFYHNDPGYAIAFPVTNKDTKDFTPDKWYMFE